MPQIIGVAAHAGRDEWVSPLLHFRWRSLVEVNLLEPVPNVPVDVWIVTIPKGVAPETYSEWLQRLRAPIILVSYQPRAASALAGSVPMIAFVCHPLRFAEDVFSLVYLAKQRTAGTKVLDAPKAWREQLRLAA